MELLLQESMEFDLELRNLNHFTESIHDVVNIALHELSINDCIEEITKDYLIEEKVSDFVAKVKDVIDNIIKAILKLVDDSIVKVKAYFQDKKAKETISKLKEADIKYDGRKVKVYMGEYAKKELDLYIREVTKLERKLMNIKFVDKLSPVKNNSAVIECNKIAKELDELNDKFDKSLLDENKYIIEVAKSDAIRFCDKELDSISVDYKELEKGSKEILVKFKKDINGCEVPEKANLLQKMCSAIGTRTRYMVQKFTTFKQKNIYLVATIAAGLLALKHPAVKSKVDSAVKKYTSKEYLDGLRAKTEEMKADTARREELLRKMKNAT